MSASPELILRSDALVILCGPAASGKSTFARRRFRATQIVSSDRCRAWVADDEANLAVSPRAFDLFHRLIDHRLALGRLTVADSTALSPRARRELRRLARRHGRPMVLIAFDVSAAVCRRNNRTRRRRVPPDVIDEHRRRFREESAHFAREGYAAVHRLTPRSLLTARVRIAKET